MKKKEMKIEDLAVITQKGFLELGSHMNKGFTEVDKRFIELDKKMDTNFQHVNARLDKIREDISDIPVMGEELKELRGRVERLERKTGVR